MISVPENLKQNFNNWVSWNGLDSAAAKDMIQLAKNKEYDFMRSLLNKRQAFGTAGIRAKMGIG